KGAHVMARSGAARPVVNAVRAPIGPMFPVVRVPAQHDLRRRIARPEINIAEERVARIDLQGRRCPIEQMVVQTGAQSGLMGFGARERRWIARYPGPAVSTTGAGSRSGGQSIIRPY